MLQQLINHSPDLQRLIEDGYELSVNAGHLVVDNVPYVSSDRKVKRGRLVSELSLSGDRTVQPHTHIMMFDGEQPCDHQGKPLTKIMHQASKRALGGGLVITHSFSSKPKIGYYADFYEKVTTYEAILSSQAARIDPSVTARTFRVVENTDETSSFMYMDTASTRSGIGAVTQKLQLRSIHIVGLGGTGAYVLDAIAKTPVSEIQLHDGDIFGQHNAFRAPGAPGIEDLRRREPKVDYYKGIYSRMHRGIVANAAHIDSSNVACLRDADFVFVCIDSGDAKRLIIETLEDAGIPFIDVGMGVQFADDGLIGMIRVTTSTPAMRAHVHDKKRIPLHSANENNLYTRNIQIADLNMLNAAMAVMKFKKLFGFYVDLEGEHFSALSIDGNHLLNEDAA
jgi:hypothetical protein